MKKYLPTSEIPNLIDDVCQTVGISKEAFFGKSKKRQNVIARQIVTYLLRNSFVNENHKPFSFPFIGRTANRDHSSIVNQFQRAEFDLTFDKAFRAHFNQIFRKLKSTKWNFEPIIPALAMKEMHWQADENIRLKGKIAELSQKIRTLTIKLESAETELKTQYQARLDTIEDGYGTKPAQSA